MKNKKQFLKSYLLQQAKINRLSEMISKNPKKKEQYRKEIKECEELRYKVEEKISVIENDLLKEILIQKYLCGKTLEEISLIINYSKRHTERLHIKALELLII